MGNNTRKPVPSLEEIAEKATSTVEDVLLDQEVGASITGNDGVEKVLVSKEWLTGLERDLEDLQIRLKYAERPVLTKVKDAVVENKRKIVLVGSTVAALGAAAFAVTHRDEIAHKLEETAEVVAEKTEHTADEVKKDARQARTGSRTK